MSKKATSFKNPENDFMKANKSTRRSDVTDTETRKRTSAVSEVSTPTPKKKKSDPLPGSNTKLVRKGSWKRRPKPAHSGVPAPEKMKRLMEKDKQDADCTLESYLLEL